MRRPILGVAAIFILTIGQAAAEGVVRPPSRIKAPGTVVGPSWGGFYVGAGFGAGAVSHELSGEEEQWERLFDRCGEIWVRDGYKSFQDSGTSDAGIFGTVSIGYDRVLREGWVGGVFADYDFGSDISGIASLPKTGVSLDHNYSWAVGGRLGFLVTPSTLLFGTAGYTQADFDIGPYGSKTFAGYFVGAGVETFLSQSWTLKLEYRFSQFGSETIVDQNSLTADLEASMHTARLVLSYKLSNPD